MSTSRLSTKGRLVVPKQIRDFLGLEPGDRIDFVVEEDGRVSLRAALVDFRSLRGTLRTHGAASLSLGQMERAIRRRQGRSW